MNIITFDEVVDLLLKGEIGVMPTDTVYGLVAQATNESAVTRMYKLKNREHKPGTLIASTTNQLIALGVSSIEIERVTKYWPNPLSAVLSVNGSDYLHQSVGTLAMRVVADSKIGELLERTGPLITSSANQPGEPPAITIKEAFAYFGDSVDFYVDGGKITDTLPSTIIRTTPSGIEILRQGSIYL